MAVAGQVVDTLAGLLASLAVGAQGGQDRIEPPGVQLVPPVLAPLGGQVRAGAVDGLGDIAQMPLGMVDVDDFDGAGELFGGQIPDPLGPVADDDASRRGVEAAAPRFAIRPLRERGRQRVGGAAGRALDRGAVADRPGPPPENRGRERPDGARRRPSPTDSPLVSPSWFVLPRRAVTSTVAVCRVVGDVGPPEGAHLAPPHPRQEEELCDLVLGWH